MLPELTRARCERAVRDLRRSQRNELTNLIESVEADLECRLDGFMPLWSKPALTSAGRRAAEDELIQMLREATDSNRYRLHGRPILSRRNGVHIDELTSAGRNRDRHAEVVVKELATRIQRARSLRGRGGRYGMIAGGLGSEALAELPIEELTDEQLGALTGEFRVAVQRYRQLVTQALRREHPVVMRCLRRAYDQMAAEGVGDGAYRELFTEVEQNVLDLIVGGRLTWRKLVAQKLGLTSNPRRIYAPRRRPMAETIPITPHPLVALAA
jgi:hypothetical protein